MTRRSLVDAMLLEAEPAQRLGGVDVSSVWDFGAVRLKRLHGKLYGNTLADQAIMRSLGFGGSITETEYEAMLRKLESLGLGIEVLGQEESIAHVVNTLLLKEYLEKDLKFKVFKNPDAFGAREWSFTVYWKGKELFTRDDCSSKESAEKEAHEDIQRLVRDTKWLEDLVAGTKGKA